MRRRVFRAAGPTLAIGVSAVLLLSACGGVDAGSTSTSPAPTKAPINAPVNVVSTISFEQPVDTVVATPAGSVVHALESGERGSVFVMDASTLAVEGSLQVGSSPSAPVALPDGTAIYYSTAVDNARVVQAVNTASDSIEAPAQLPRPRGGGVAAPDSSSIYYVYLGVLGDDSGVGLRILDTASNQVTTELSLPKYSHSPVVSPDGSELYVINRTSVAVVNLKKEQVRYINVPSASLASSAITPDGSTLYVAGVATGDEAPLQGLEPDAYVWAIDTKKQEVVKRIRIGPGPRAILMHPDGSSVYAVSNGDNTVSTVDVVTNALKSSTSLDANALLATPIMLPDGSAVYIPDVGNGVVEVFDTTTNEIAATVPIGNGTADLIGAALADSSQVWIPNRVDQTVTVIGRS